MFCRAFSLPRQGHGLDEYEDAVAADAGRGRFAVADGASESGFAAVWARLLVAEFVRAEGGDDWAWLAPLQRRWADEVGAAPLAWYAETKFQQGAYATFLGLMLGPERWRALAVGDSCLFHVRDGRLCRAFPLTSAAEFGATPCLVGSRHLDPEAVERKAQRAEGEWRPGDALWLMTDALAHWCLAHAEHLTGPWAELDRLAEGGATDDDFAAWVQQLRAERRLRNDDVTALLVRP
jgi:hypothetical protein